MGKLSELFNQAIAKEKLGEEVYLPSYRTGIDIFDYINGYEMSDGTIALGIQAGKLTMDVGQSGTGKSSKVIKQACFIADQFEDSDVWHYDFERSSNKERIMKLAGWDEEHYNEKYHLFQKGISAETIYNACKKIEKIKNEHFDEIKVEMPNGNYGLPPTLMIIDSVALMAPEDIEDSDDLRGQTGAMSIAKSNTNIFKRIASPMINGNIIVMLVNHITQKIDINPMAKSKALVNFLGQDDAIPGGKILLYLSNTLTKLVTGAKLEPDKEFGIKGYYLTGLLAKSRNTEAGISFKMVFEQKVGINNLLTNFVNMKDLGRIKGAGRGYYLDTCPDVKFTQKEFSNKYNENKTLKKEFDKAVDEEYSKFISFMNKTSTSSSKKENEYKLIDKENEVYINVNNNKYYQIEDGDYIEVEYED